MFIERMSRTLKQEAIWPNAFDSVDQAISALVAWIQGQNTERPHASPGGCIPAEARAEVARHKAAG
mgnify:FL=1